MTPNHVIRFSQRSCCESKQFGCVNLPSRRLKRINTMRSKKAKSTFGCEFKPTIVGVSLILLKLSLVAGVILSKTNPPTPGFELNLKRATESSLANEELLDFNKMPSEWRSLKPRNEEDAAAAIQLTTRQDGAHTRGKQGKKSNGPKTMRPNVICANFSEGEEVGEEIMIDSSVSVDEPTIHQQSSELDLMELKHHNHRKRHLHQPLVATTNRKQPRPPPLGEGQTSGLTLKLFGVEAAVSANERRKPNENQGQVAASGGIAPIQPEVSRLTAGGKFELIDEKIDRSASEMTTVTLGDKKPEKIDDNDIANSNESGSTKSNDYESKLLLGKSDNEISEIAGNGSSGEDSRSNDNTINPRRRATRSSSAGNSNNEEWERRENERIEREKEEELVATTTMKSTTTTATTVSHSKNQAATWLEASDRSDLETEKLKCRIEKNEYLNFWEYKHYACAHCYDLIPSIMFTRKLIHKREDRVYLYDELNNRTLLPDKTDFIRSTFRHDEIYTKWIDCCKSAIECCKQNSKYLPTTEQFGKLIDKTNVCPGTWDGLTCWPDTQPGTVQTRECMAHVYNQEFEPDCKGSVTKECFSNASWYIRNNHEWSNYKTCNTAYIYFIRLLIGSLWLFFSGVVAIAPALLILDRMPNRGSSKRIRILRNILLWLLICSILSIAHRTGVMMKVFTRDTHPTRVARPPFGLDSRRDLVMGVASTNTSRLTVSISQPPSQPASESLVISSTNLGLKAPQTDGDSSNFPPPKSRQVFSEQSSTLKNRKARDRYAESGEPYSNINSEEDNREYGLLLHKSKDEDRESQGHAQSIDGKQASLLLPVPPVSSSSSIESKPVIIMQVTSDGVMAGIRSTNALAETGQEQGQRQQLREQVADSEKMPATRIKRKVRSCLTINNCDVQNQTNTTGTVAEAKEGHTSGGGKLETGTGTQSSDWHLVFSPEVDTDDGNLIKLTPMSPYSQAKGQEIKGEQVAAFSLDGYRLRRRAHRPTSSHYTALIIEDVIAMDSTSNCAYCSTEQQQQQQQPELDNRRRLNKRAAIRESVSSNMQQAPIYRVACWVITVLGRTARLMCYSWMFTGAVYLCSILHWAPAEPPARFVRYLLMGTTIFPITIEIIYVALRTYYDASPLNLLFLVPYYQYMNNTAYVDYLWASQLECWFDPSIYSFIESVEDYPNLILVSANVFLFLITLLIMCRMDRPGCTRQEMNVWDYFKAAGTLVSLYGTHYTLFAYRPYWDSNCLMNQITYYTIIWFDGIQGAVVAWVFCYKTADGKEIVYKWLRNKTVFGSLYKSTFNRSNEDNGSHMLYGTTSHSLRSNNSNGINGLTNELATELIDVNENPMPTRF